MTVKHTPTQAAIKLMNEQYNKIEELRAINDKLIEALERITTNVYILKEDENTSIGENWRFAKQVLTEAKENK